MQATSLYTAVLILLYTSTIGGVRAGEAGSGVDASTPLTESAPVDVRCALAKGAWCKDFHVQEVSGSPPPCHVYMQA